MDDRLGMIGMIGLSHHEGQWGVLVFLAGRQVAVISNQHLGPGSWRGALQYNIRTKLGLATYALQNHMGSNG